MYYEVIFMLPSEHEASYVDSKPILQRCGVEELIPKDSSGARCKSISRVSSRAYNHGIVGPDIDDSSHAEFKKYHTYHLQTRSSFFQSRWIWPCQEGR